MLSSPWCLWIVCQLLATIISAQPASSNSVSILDTPAFSAQRLCAQHQFSGTCFECFELASALGCPAPYQNSCFCNPVLISDALSIISQRVWSHCNQDLEDVETAQNIYRTYCVLTTLETTGYVGNDNYASPELPISQRRLLLRRDLSGGATAGLSIAGFAVAVLTMCLAWQQIQIMRSSGSREKTSQPENTYASPPLRRYPSNDGSDLEHELQAIEARIAAGSEPSSLDGDPYARDPYARPPPAPYPHAAPRYLAPYPHQPN
jgi:hypothetical protein